MFCFYYLPYEAQANTLTLQTQIPRTAACPGCPFRCDQALSSTAMQQLQEAAEQRARNRDQAIDGNETGGQKRDQKRRDAERAKQADQAGFVHFNVIAICVISAKSHGACRSIVK
jgi:hypothetical protein